MQLRNSGTYKHLAPPLFSSPETSAKNLNAEFLPLTLEVKTHAQNHSFEIATDNPECVAKFHKKVFGWKIQKWSGPAACWLVTTGQDKEPGINGAIMEKVEQAPAATINTVNVLSVDKFVQKITDAGGKVLSPKRAVPGIGYMAYCVDTEGIVFGILQADASAK